MAKKKVTPMFGDEWLAKEAEQIWMQARLWNQTKSGIALNNEKMCNYVKKAIQSAAAAFAHEFIAEHMEAQRVAVSQLRLCLKAEEGRVEKLQDALIEEAKERSNDGC